MCHVQASHDSRRTRGGCRVLLQMRLPGVRRSGVLPEVWSKASKYDVSGAGVGHRQFRQPLGGISPLSPRWRRDTYFSYACQEFVSPRVSEVRPSRSGVEGHDDLGPRHLGQRHGHLVRRLRNGDWLRCRRVVHWAIFRRRFQHST